MYTILNLALFLFHFLSAHPISAEQYEAQVQQIINEYATYFNTSYQVGVTH